MKKILYIELSSGFGGSSNALYNFLKYLNKDKFQPVLLITRQGRNFELISKMGVETICVSFFNLKNDGSSPYLISYFKAAVNLVADIFLNSWVVRDVIRREKIDLVHVNTVISNNYQSILAAKWSGIPCISHVRETKALSKLEEYFKRFIDRIVVLNKEVFEMLSEGYDPKKIFLVPDGLDLSLSVQEKDLQKIKEGFALEGKCCVGILGRLLKEKGQENFIRAAAIVLKAHKNIKFLIVGNDPDQNNLYEQRLRFLVQELHIEDNLIFTGWRTDKNEIISVLDIVVQASSFPEGFGLTCIEAMAFQKPVVATNITGPNSIVIDGVTGFLVPVSAPEALAAAITKIIENPGLARNMGEAGHARVEKYFDIKNVVQKVEDLYENVFLETSHRSA